MVNSSFSSPAFLQTRIFRCCLIDIAGKHLAQCTISFPEHVDVHFDTIERVVLNTANKTCELYRKFFRFDLQASCSASRTMIIAPTGKPAGVFSVAQRQYIHFRRYNKLLETVSGARKFNFQVLIKKLSVKEIEHPPPSKNKYLKIIL